MKNQYTLDISEYSNKYLTDCFKYDQLLMEMNAQVLSEYIPKLLYQIQFLYRKGHMKNNPLDFREFDGDYFFIDEVETRVVKSSQGIVYKNFIAHLHSGQQSRFELSFEGYTYKSDNTALLHDYTVEIKDLEYTNPKIVFSLKLVRGDDGSLGLEQLDWLEKPSTQGDTAHLMRRLLRLVNGLEFLLTKEMNDEGEWQDIENNTYKPLSELRDKTIKLSLVSNLFEVDKQLIRAESIDKIID